MCDTQKKHGRNLCFKTNAFRFNILNSIYERFYCFNGDQDNRVIPEKKLREKMMNLSKQNGITIDMNVVNKNDNSRTTSSSASN